MRDGAPEYLRITPSGEIYLKSRQTRPRFLNILIGNVEAGLEASEVPARVVKSGHHELRIESDQLQRAADIASRAFGVRRVEQVRELHFEGLDDLGVAVADLARPGVADRKFAVRVRRSGKHDWRSNDAEVMIGRLLLDDSSGVDLDDPDVTVRVHVRSNAALVVRESWDGPDGLPLGSQERALVLLSGGIDSPVAAWMMMRRGCPVDMVHFKLDCAQSDHALSVGYEVAMQYGHGHPGRMHVLDFQPAKNSLRRDLGPELRQIALKQLMIDAASRLADRIGVSMLVTGDSLGQVSSQTAAHLVALDQLSRMPILRPLVALSKDEIIRRAHAIGTYELSIRGREVCDLSGGRPVVTSASAREVRAAAEKLESGVVDEAMASWEMIAAPDWHPGVPLNPAA